MTPRRTSTALPSPARRATNLSKPAVPSCARARATCYAASTLDESLMVHAVALREKGRCREDAERQAVQAGSVLAHTDRRGAQGRAETHRRHPLLQQGRQRVRPDPGLQRPADRPRSTSSAFIDEERTTGSRVAPGQDCCPGNIQQQMISTQRAEPTLGAACGRGGQMARPGFGRRACAHLWRDSTPPVARSVKLMSRERWGAFPVRRRRLDDGPGRPR